MANFIKQFFNTTALERNSWYSSNSLSKDVCSKFYVDYQATSENLKLKLKQRGTNRLTEGYLILTIRLSLEPWQIVAF